MIKVERILNVDPESQLISSIIAKKLAVGSKYVLIDIPYGKGAKVSKSEGLRLKRKFLIMAKYFGMKMKVVLTLGNQPIGNGIGPVLEMIDILKVLKRSLGPIDLEKKSIFLAGQLLEMLGKTKIGDGEKLAEKILDSGEALKKFNEIINAQGRKNFKLVPAKFKKTIFSSKKGRIKEIDNKMINNIGRKLGCPVDKRAGIYIYKHLGNKVNKGGEIITFYAESTTKLKDAISFYNLVRPIRIG